MMMNLSVKVREVERDITFGSLISDTSASQEPESESVMDKEEIFSAEQLLGEDFECEAVNNGTD